MATWLVALLLAQIHWCKARLRWRLVWFVGPTHKNAWWCPGCILLRCLAKPFANQICFFFRLGCVSKLGCQRYKHVEGFASFLSRTFLGWSRYGFYFLWKACFAANWLFPSPLPRSCLEGRCLSTSNPSLSQLFSSLARRACFLHAHTVPRILLQYLASHRSARSSFIKYPDSASTRESHAWNASTKSSFPLK